jgi:hypothetical protein
MVERVVGTDEAESGPAESALRSDVVHRRVGDHPGQSTVGGYGQQRDERLCGVAVAAGRRSQTVADLDAAAVWLALEADPADGLPVGQAGDPVVAERPLLSARSGGAKEAPDSANIALEGVIVGPSVAESRTSRDDAFSLCDIDRMQPQARRSNIGHGASEAAPIAKHHQVSP